VQQNREPTRVYEVNNKKIAKSSEEYSQLILYLQGADCYVFRK